MPEYPTSTWYFKNWQKYKANHPHEKEYIANAEKINRSIKPDAKNQTVILRNG